MNTFASLAAVAAVAALAVRLAGRQHRLLHLLQLEHYENARLLLWLRRRGELLAPRELLAATLVFAAATIAQASGSPWLCGALLLASCPLAAPGVADWRREAITPLVFTGRAKRLLAAALLPPAALLVATIALAATGLTTATLACVLALGVLLLAAAPWTLTLANRVLQPLQRSINRRYEQRAIGSLRDHNPLVVAITGSYGKTTTKFCVGAVLEADRPTLVTPESYNSYLGVLRTINEHLQPSHEAFVVEMGMFRRGDIAELCELVHPKIGVITAIGPMHLERLGSIEAIAAAKGELLDALPPDGHFVTNGADPRCLQLAARSHVPVTLFEVEHPPAPADVAQAPQAPLSTTRTPLLSQKNNPPTRVLATNVRLAEGRTTFTLAVDPPDGPEVEVSAGLLGAHNVSNLLAAAAVGHVLGMPLPRIAQGLAQVEAPAHRLQPIHNRAAGVVVIDDAYNSNPDGAAAALQVLREHPATRRLLVTPGMVELGALEAELNRRFGEQAAAVCDIAILVGPARTAPIREGLIGAGLAESSIQVVRDIAEATTLLAGLTRAGDVILFENDLPDTYSP